MATVKISVSNAVVEQTLSNILAVLRRLEDALMSSSFDDAAVAAAIRKNTEALSGLSTYPPSAAQPAEENDMSEPGQQVNQALTQQTQAIAQLSAELADEHQEWIAAVNSGDQGQAEQIVARVQENTDKLNSLASDLAGSHPGSTEGPTPTPV